jgi:hypothetical protein
MRNALSSCSILSGSGTSAMSVIMNGMPHERLTCSILSGSGTSAIRMDGRPDESFRPCSILSGSGTSAITDGVAAMHRICFLQYPQRIRNLSNRGSLSGERGLAEGERHFRAFLDLSNGSFFDCLISFSSLQYLLFRKSVFAEKQGRFAKAFSLSLSTNRILMRTDIVRIFLFL